MNDEPAIIEATRRWIETVVVRNRFCPFAGKPLAQGAIVYSVTRAAGPEPCLEALVDLCLRLEREPQSETALLICPQAFDVFPDYLDLVDMAERLLVLQGYEGIYQLASFHPDYCFAGAARDDPANYTNRSPYPMLHLLRESALTQALQNHDSPESIPDRNIATARRIGLDKLREDLLACTEGRDKDRS